MNFDKLFNTIDTHVAGKAFRIVLYSPIALVQGNIHEMDEQLQQNFTNAKNLLLNEPRGHRGMHGAIVAPSANADFRLLFFSHAASPDFHYEGLLTTTTALLETGNIAPKASNSYDIETVKGMFTVQATMVHGEVVSAKLTDISANEVDRQNDVTTICVNEERHYLLYELPAEIPTLELEHLGVIANWGIAKAAELTAEQCDFDGIIVVENNASTITKVRSVTFEKDGYILRSPGVDSTVAILTARTTEGTSTEVLENESIYGSSLTATAESIDPFRFSIETRAFVTGSHQFMFDPDDPLKEGFLLA